MNAEQNAGAAPSDVFYTRLGYRRNVPSLGRFWSEASLEKVEDGVEDPLSVYGERALTTAEQADRILVFDRGRIVEQGGHADLVAAGGVYAALYQSWLGNTRVTPR